MNLLFIGDIVGRPGRDLIRRHVRALAAHYRADLVIANGENAAGGAGITRENMLEILSAGVDVITGGNHVWDKRETLEFIGNEPRLIRPANYPGGRVRTRGPRRLARRRRPVCSTALEDPALPPERERGPIPHSRNHVESAR